MQLPFQLKLLRLALGDEERVTVEAQIPKSRSFALLRRVVGGSNAASTVMRVHTLALTTNEVPPALLWALRQAMGFFALISKT